MEELTHAADADIAGDALAALVQADRLQDTIAHLEDLARGPARNRPTWGRSSAFTRRRSRLGGALPARRRELSVDAAQGQLARIAPESVRQIVDVLLDNALAHGIGATSVVVAQTRAPRA